MIADNFDIEEERRNIEERYRNQAAQLLEIIEIREDLVKNRFGTV